MRDPDDDTAPDDLIAHAEFVRRLARHLLGRGAEAEDVAQDALTLALERPPGVVRNLRAWLAGVVRNLVLTRRRAEARRDRRERLAPSPPTPPTPAETAARMETARRLVSAVHRLEEPYRSTIVLRFFDEVSTREIARRYDVPFETVRTRLKRGLARLRASIGRDGDRKATRRGLLLLAGVPGTLIDARTAGLMGATLMGKKLAAVITVLAVLAALSVLGLVLVAGRDLFSDAPGPGPTGVARGRAAPDREPAEETGETVGLSGRPESGEEVPPEGTGSGSEVSSPGERVVRGRVLGLDPTAGGEVALTLEGFGPWGTSTQRSVRAVAARDGTFVVDVAALFSQDVDVDEVSVLADHPDHLPARTRVPIDRLGDVEIRLLRSGAVLVRVVDEAGDPLSGASVSLHLRPADGEVPPARVQAGETDGDGRARLRTAENGPHLVVAAVPGRRPAAAEVAVTVRGEVEAETLVLTRGVTISGRVREAPPTGLPLVVEAQRLRVRSWSVGRCSVCLVDGRPEHAAATATVDGEGRFVLEGLAPGSHLLRIESSLRARLHMHVSETHEATVDAPAGEVDLEQLVASRITAEVRIDGRPVPKAHLAFFLQGAVSRSTDGDGRATVWVVPGATYRVSASGPREREGVERDVVAPGPGEERVEVFELPTRRARATLEVTLRPPRGAAAIERCAFGLFDPEDDGPFPEDSRDAAIEDGRYVLRDVPAGRWRLVARPGGRWWMNDGPWLDAETAVEIPRQGTVKVSLDVRSGGRLRVVVRDPSGRYLAPRCRVRDGEGRPIDLLFTHRVAGGSSRMRNRMVGSGLNHVDPALAPGEYEMTLTMDGYREKTVPFVVVAGRTETVDVALEPE